ncbi:hypothetical protein GCM10028805_30880 [Spirosoma harenae]
MQLKESRKSGALCFIFAKKKNTMAASETIPTKLSNLQMELLKLYPYMVSEEELKEIRQVLADHFARKVDSEMNQLWQENGWNEQTIEGWKNEHLRSHPNQ